MSRDELERLDVIESKSLKAGSAFHAFKFAAFDVDLAGDRVQGVVDDAITHLVKDHGLSFREAVDTIEKIAAPGIAKALEEATAEALKSK